MEQPVALGGSSRLRSYAGGRFSGAHTEFYGYEFRWNLTDENTPFDLYFIKDFRTGFQLAFFYETGTVAEQREDLWTKSRNSTGLGPVWSQAQALFTVSMWLLAQKERKQPFLLTILGAQSLNKFSHRPIG